MGSWGFGTFENDSAADLVGGTVHNLELQLVRFRHRVRFRWAMNYAEARAAMVLLSHLVKLPGVSWIPAEDATPELVRRAFDEFFELQSLSSFPAERRNAIEADIDVFAALPYDWVSPLPPEHTLEGIVRRGGAAPDVCNWASLHSNLDDAWESGDALQLASLAAAAGVEFAWAIAAFTCPTLEALEHVQTDHPAVRRVLIEAANALQRKADIRQVGLQVQSAVNSISPHDGMYGLAQLLQRLVCSSGSPLSARDPEQWADLASLVERELKHHKVAGVSALRRILGPHVRAAAPAGPDSEEMVSIQLLKPR